MSESSIIYFKCDLCGNEIKGSMVSVGEEQYHINCYATRDKDTEIASLKAELETAHATWSHDIDQWLKRLDKEEKENERLKAERDGLRKALKEKKCFT